MEKLDKDSIVEKYAEWLIKQGIAKETSATVYKSGVKNAKCWDKTTTPLDIYSLQLELIKDTQKSSDLKWFLSYIFICIRNQKYDVSLLNLKDEKTYYKDEFKEYLRESSDEPNSKGWDKEPDDTFFYRNSIVEIDTYIDSYANDPNKLALILAYKSFLLSRHLEECMPLTAKNKTTIYADALYDICAAWYSLYAKKNGFHNEALSSDMQTKLRIITSIIADKAKSDGVQDGLGMFEIASKVTQDSISSDKLCDDETLIKIQKICQSSTDKSRKNIWTDMEKGQDGIRIRSELCHLLNVENIDEKNFLKAAKNKEELHKVVKESIRSKFIKSEIPLFQRIVKSALDDYHEKMGNYVWKLPLAEDLTQQYKDKLSADAQTDLKYGQGEDSKEKRNLIFFGAPGTGKSNKLKEKSESLACDTKNRERVTFHSDYSYFDFVGSYRPIMSELREKDTDRPVYENVSKVGAETSSGMVETSTKKKIIQYEFVPGPFMRMLTKALIDIEKNAGECSPHILIIEEINRARAASVFGDTFQLLDRDKNNVSTYGITISKDVRDYIRNEYEQNGITTLYNWEQVCELRIPSNMYIWATMNSADQGVYPLDTAFKRRWSFKYIGIDEGESVLTEKKKDEKGKESETYRFGRTWNEWRKAINNTLLKHGINEDKQLGPFFLRPAEDLDTAEHFRTAFSEKVLMYLREDVIKNNVGMLFCEIDGNKKPTYSQIIGKFKNADKITDVLKLEISEKQSQAWPKNCIIPKISQ